MAAVNSMSDESFVDESLQAGGNAISDERKTFFVKIGTNEITTERQEGFIEVEDGNIDRDTEGMFQMDGNESELSESLSIEKAADLYRAQEENKEEAVKQKNNVEAVKQKNVQQGQVDTLMKQLLQGAGGDKLQSLTEISPGITEIQQIRVHKKELQQQLNDLLKSEGWNQAAAEVLVRATAKKVDALVESGREKLSASEITADQAKIITRIRPLPWIPVVGRFSLKSERTAVSERINVIRRNRIITKLNIIQKSEDAPFAGINRVMSFRKKGSTRSSTGLVAGGLSKFKKMRVGIKQAIRDKERSDENMDAKYTQQAKLILAELQEHGMNQRSAKYQNIKKRLVWYRWQYLQNRKNTLSNAQKTKL